MKFIRLTGLLVLAALSISCGSRSQNGYQSPEHVSQNFQALLEARRTGLMYAVPYGGQANPMVRDLCRGSAAAKVNRMEHGIFGLLAELDNRMNHLGTLGRPVQLSPRRLIGSIRPRRDGVCDPYSCTRAQMDFGIDVFQTLITQVPDSGAINPITHTLVRLTIHCDTEYLNLQTLEFTEGACWLTDFEIPQP